MSTAITVIAAETANMAVKVGFKNCPSEFVRGLFFAHVDKKVFYFQKVKKFKIVLGQDFPLGTVLEDIRTENLRIDPDWQFNLKGDSVMTKNEASWDRVLRVLVGLVLIALAATQTIGLWGYVGVVPLLTGAVGFCPLYRLLGLSTCPVRR